MKDIEPKISHRVIINLLRGFYCSLMILTLFLCFPISIACSKPTTISLGEGIAIDNILIKFKSVRISPLYETGRLSMFFEPIVEKPKENYKFVVITVDGENIGKRGNILGGLGSTQYFEIEVDKGYFYSTILGGSRLVFNLLPEETKEGRLVFQIPQGTKPTKLHCNIEGRRFVVVLDESKFIYSKGAKISIEDYKISYGIAYEYNLNAHKPLEESRIPVGYKIHSINPVVRNSGDLPIIVNFEVEISGFKEVGTRNPYVLPSNSVLTLEVFSFSTTWYWQNLKTGDYPIIPGGEHLLKIIVKDETGKVVADKIFSVLLK